MKNISFFLLFIPIFCIAQTEINENTNFSQQFNYSKINDRQNNIEINNQKETSKQLFNKETEEDNLLDSVYTYKLYNYPDALTDSLLMDKQYYRYDKNMNLICDSSCLWIEDPGIWIGNERYEYAYDISGNVKTKLSFAFDYEIGQTIGSQKVEYIYEKDSLVSSAIYSKWYQYRQIWVYNFKNEFKYNSSGNSLLFTRYYYTTQWDTGYQHVYIYDANSYISSKIEKNWDSDLNKFTSDAIDEYTTDSLGRVISLIRSSTYNNTKKYIQKWEYGFDKYGNKISINSNLWDTTTLQWTNHNKEEYEYDVEGHQLLYCRYEWNKDSVQWIKFQKSEYAYDANNNLVEILSYNVKKSTNEWIIRGKTNYLYDNNNNKKSILQYVWDTDSLNWNTYKSKYFYYSGNSYQNSIDDNDGANMFYPNPVNEIIKIELGRIAPSNCQLLDFNGHILNSYILNSNINTLNTSYLKSGIYFIKIKSRDGVIIKKIIKN